MEKAKAAKGHKTTCGWLLIEQGSEKMNGPVHVKLTFHPPDNRRRDLDGMLSASKQALDAVSHAIGVDDYEFSLTLVRGESRPKDGLVVMEVSCMRGAQS